MTALARWRARTHGVFRSAPNAVTLIQDTMVHDLIQSCGLLPHMKYEPCRRVGTMLWRPVTRTRPYAGKLDYAACQPVASACFTTRTTSRSLMQHHRPNRACACAWKARKGVWGSP